MSNINASPSPSPQAASVSNPNSSQKTPSARKGRKTEGCEQPVAKPSPPGAQKLVHPTGGRRDPRKVASPEDVVPTSGPLKEPKIVHRMSWHSEDGRSHSGWAEIQESRHF